MSLLYKKKMVRKFKPTKIRKRSYAKRKANPKISRRRFKRRGVAPSGMPRVSSSKIRYCDVVTLQSTIGVLGSHVFRANSIYDPDFTGTGHQPMSHDTWATLFNHYTVTGAKISITVHPLAGNTTSGMVGVFLNAGSSAPYAGVPGFIEAKRGAYRQISVKSVKGAKLVQKFSSKRFFNVSDVKDVGKLGAAFGADPSEEAYFVIWYQDQEASTSSVRITVVIDYFVQFSEPKHLAQS